MARVKSFPLGNNAFIGGNSLDREGVKGMNRVTVVHEGSSERLQIAYQLLANFFWEYLDKNTKNSEKGEVP